MALIEGRYPNGMQVRCSKCERVRAVEEGEFLTVRLAGSGSAQAFRCNDCSQAA